MFFIDYWYASLHKTDYKPFLFKAETKPQRIIGFYLTLYLWGLIKYLALPPFWVSVIFLLAYFGFYTYYEPKYIAYIIKKYDELDQTYIKECKIYTFWFKIIAILTFSLSFIFTL
jgi:hypothetical protein